MTVTQSAADTFTAFARRHSPSLARTAWLLTGDADTARDLTQAALVKVYLAWRRVEPDGALAYARRVLINEARSRHRRDREVPVAEPTAAALPDGSADLANRDQVLRLLGRLSEKQRQVIVLRYYADLTEAEVAATLGIPLGSVKSTTHRALDAMRTFALSQGELA